MDKIIEQMMLEEIQEAIARTMKRAVAEHLPQYMSILQDANEGNAIAQKYIEEHGAFSGIGKTVNRYADKLITAIKN